MDLFPFSKIALLDINNKTMSNFCYCLDGSFVFKILQNVLRGKNSNHKFKKRYFCFRVKYLLENAA